LPSTRGVTLVSKVGVPIQKENKASLDPEAREEENGEEVPNPHLTDGSGRASLDLCVGSGAEPRPKMVLL